MKKLHLYFKTWWTRIWKTARSRPEIVPNSQNSGNTTRMGRPATHGENKGANDLVNELEKWLLKHYSFRFNLLTETTEIRAANATGQPYLPIDNRRMNGLCIDARKAGINCWDRDINRFIHSCHIPSYHPFRHFIENLPQWDGEDRIRPLAERVSDKPLWVMGFRRWMLAMVAQWMELDNQHGNSVAPVLVSQQQGRHKSTFCKLLLPENLQTHYTDSFDLTASARAEQKLSFFGLINLDEFDKFTPRKMAILKNIMQMAGINFKKAYKKSFSHLPRMASFIATTNQKELLTDPSGSRRFLCVEIDRTIDCTPPDHLQIYAQLKSELLAGERYWFTAEEEAAITENNLAFQKRLIEEDVFFRCFRPAATGEPDSLLLTAAEIFQHLKKENPSAMLQSSPVHFGRFLTALGIEKIRKENNTVYKVIKLTNTNSD